MKRLNSLGMSGHQSPVRGKTNDWLTPPWLIERLGPFDLDPCCPPDMPWRTATTMLTPADDGLSVAWSGRVWLNPPYGDEISPWLERMGWRQSGIALIFARTETAYWQDHVWPVCTAVLFLRGRLHFHRPCGERAKLNSGAPSALVAYSEDDAHWLASSKLQGALVRPTICT
jgi:hypothetical protein